MSRHVQGIVAITWLESWCEQNEIPNQFGGGNPVSEMDPWSRHW